MYKFKVINNIKYSDALKLDDKLKQDGNGSYDS